MQDTEIYQIRAGDSNHAHNYLLKSWNDAWGKQTENTRTQIVTRSMFVCTCGAAYIQATIYKKPED